MHFISLLLKSYRNNKFSMLMLIVSLSIAVTGLSSVLLINNSAKQSYSSNNTLLVSNVSHQVIAKQDSSANQAPLTKQDYVMLRRQGFDELVAVAQVKSHIYTSEKRVTSRRVEFTGIDSFAFTSFVNTSGALNQSDAFSNLGAMNTIDSQSALLHPTLLAQLTQGNDRSSQDLFIKNETQQSHSALPVLRPIEEASLGNDIILDIGRFYQLFPEQALSMLLVISSENQASVRINRLKSQLPEHLILAEIDNGNDQSEMTESFHLNLMAMALLMFVVCLFIVLNAVNLTIASRMPWLKVCRQLGINRRQIFATQLAELIFLTAICSLLGIYLSIHLANFVSPAVQATLEGLYAVELGFGKPSLLSLFLQVFGISVVGTMLATVFSFSQANKSLSSIKDDSTTNTNATSTVFWYLFGACSVVGVLILFFAKSLWLLLLATAFVILAGCSLLLANYPKMIELLYLCIPSKFPLLQLSVRQSAGLSARTKVACCAFFIAATSNIGMNLMVDSFRGATVSWLEQRLVSDYYLFYEGDTDINSIAQQADIELIQRYENEIEYKGLGIQQYSYPTTASFKQAMVFYAVDDVQQAWQSFEDENGVFINQQFDFNFDLQLNDIVELPHPSTKEASTYIIKGIIYDFGNTFKQVLLPISQFDKQQSSGAIYSINANDEQITAFRTRLTDAGINHERNLITTEQLLAISTRAFDQTFLITDGLNIVTLLIAALSLACAIIVLMKTVRAQNMLVRSLGVSALKTQGLALFQYAVLCIVALILATPFGILLSWILIFEINLQAFQWTYPLQIDVLKIINVYLISLAVVIAIIAIPIIRTGKKPLIEDIRWLN